MVIVAVASFPTAAQPPPSCDDVGTWVSTCSVENTGTQIEVGATTTQPGSGAGQGGAAGESGTRPSAPGSSAPSCVPGPGEMCRGNYTTAFLPEVTMADLASFRPSPPGMVSEPDGVGIAGMPVNLFSDASTHTASGTLFGYAVAVRFTPARFRFSYGDGATRTTSTPGASWASRGQAQFSPTETSHVYADRGDYVASVTAVYTAQVDFGGGWRDVPGTLELVSPGYRVQILEARTALVRDTCRENAGAPGC